MAASTLRYKLELLDPPPRCSRGAGGLAKQKDATRRNLTPIGHVGFTGFFGQTNYSAAKAGVVGLTKALSRELAHREITVNAVAPGVVLTEMGESIPESVREQMLQHIPLARFGEPEDVAAAILFLCSPQAAYITGQTIHVNGGWYG